MSSKATPAAKKGPVALRIATTRKLVPSESPTYYIVVDREQLLISTDKPKATGRVVTAANFDEAKEKALDFLIELIDKFEQRLWQVKQSLDHHSLVK